MKLLFALSVLSSKKRNLSKSVIICVLYSATLSLPLFRGDRGGLPRGQLVYSSLILFCLFCVFCVINYLRNLQIIMLFKNNSKSYSILILYYYNLFQLFKLFSFIVCEICIRV